MNKRGWNWQWRYFGLLIMPTGTWKEVRLGTHVNVDFDTCIVRDDGTKAFGTVLFLFCLLWVSISFAFWIGNKRQQEEVRWPRR